MVNDPIVVERVQELTWALLDEQITDDEMSLLDNLLLSDDVARKRYVECVQLHTGLIMHYATPAAGAKVAGTAKSPVLGFLNAGTLPLGFDLPPAEDLK
ncbi:MAG: hypothetical protein WD738_21020 [Pirellulales bacterium]